MQGDFLLSAILLDHFVRKLDMLPQMTTRATYTDLQAWLLQERYPHLVHVLPECSLKLKASRIPKPVCGWPGEREEGPLCGVRAFQSRHQHHPQPIP